MENEDKTVTGKGPETAPAMDLFQEPLKDVGPVSPVDNAAATGVTQLSLYVKMIGLE